MKSDRDIHEMEMFRVDTIPAPINKDHNYFSMTAQYSAAAVHGYDGDEKSLSGVVKNWKPLSDVTICGKPRLDVTEIRNPASDVITAGKPSTDSQNSDATAERNPSHDVTGTAKYTDNLLKSRGNPLHEIESRQIGLEIVSASPEHRASESTADALAMFTDGKADTSSSPYNMLIDVDAIGSVLLEAKSVMEPPRWSSSRMKLDSRYRTNSSDSAFSEDSFLEEDEDVKLENLISQFIFNPANLQNDLPEYVESEQSGPAEDVNELDVTDLFSSADIFGHRPNLADDPTASRFVALAEPESGWEESSENSVCSDNRDNSPVKKHTTSLLKKKDSISSLSSSSSSSSSSLSLSSLSLHPLSSSTVGRSIDDLHLESQPCKTQDGEKILDEGAVDSKTDATSLAVASSSPMGLQTKGDNFDVQGDDSTGFLTLPLAHLTKTSETQTITCNYIPNNNNNNKNITTTSTTTINNNHKNSNDYADNYEMLLNHLSNGFPPTFEIRGENSDLLLDEPDFVDFPFPSSETGNCRPNRSDFPTETTTEANRDQPLGSIGEIQSYEKKTFKAKIAAPVVDSKGDLKSENLVYLNCPLPPTAAATTTSYSEDASELHLNDVELFKDVIDLDPKRDTVNECYGEPVLSQSSFIADWLSINDSHVDVGLIGSSLHSTLSSSKHTKQRKGNDANDIVQFIVDPYSPSSSSSSSTLKSPPKKRSSSNINDVQSQILKSGGPSKSVHQLCSVKKNTSSKRPVPTLNAIKKVPHKKKSTSSHSKMLPVPADCHERKTINYLNRAPIRGRPQFNQNELNQLKSTHSPPQIEIVSWEDTGSFQVKVPKLSLNNKQSENNRNQVQCSLLREVLTAEESQCRFVQGAADDDKHGHTRAAKQCRNNTHRLSNEVSRTQTGNNGSEMSELEKYLRGLIPTDAGNKGLGKTSGGRTSCEEDLSQISVLQKLLTGEMSAHAYREIDRRICEKKKLEIK